MKKVQKFAEPTITSTYAGEFAGKYIAAALLSAKTLDNNLLTIVPNVKYKQVVSKLDVSNIIADASCDFAASGSVVLTERILEPKELQVNLQLCKQEFLDSWEALNLGYSAFDEIPKDFNDYLISYVGGKVAEATEISIWRGNGASNGQFGGLFTSIVAAHGAGGADAPIKSPVSGSIDSTNVIAALNAVVNAIPDTIYGKEDLVIYVPTNVSKAYQQALSGVANVGSFNNQLNVGEKPSNFNGIEIVLAPGLAASKIVAAQKSNLYFGTGLLSDHNEVRVLDMANIDGSQNYRIIMRYTAGTLFGIGKEIVFHN
jgi:hypothetical protein